MANNKKNAYCTLMKDDGDVDGVLALYCSYRRFIINDVDDFIVLVPDNIDDDKLIGLSSKEKIIIEKVPQISLTLDIFGGMTVAQRHQKIRDRHTGFFTFFNILKLSQYSKILYISCDSILLGDCSDIFNFSTPAGVFYMPHDINGRQDKIFYNNVTKMKLKNGEKINDVQIYNALLIGHVCNSTMILLSPEEDDFKLFNKLLAKLNTPTFNYSGYEDCLSTPVETLLCDFYFEKKMQWTNLSRFHVVSLKEKDVPLIIQDGIKPRSIQYAFSNRIWHNQEEIYKWKDSDPWTLFFNYAFCENGFINPEYTKVKRCALCDDDEHFFIESTEIHDNSLPSVKNFCTITCPKFLALKDNE